jgi:hypothetical protein
VASLEHHQILRELSTDNWSFIEAWSDLAHVIITDLVARRLLDWCCLAHVITLPFLYSRQYCNHSDKYICPTISSEGVNVNSLVIQRPHSLLPQLIRSA